MKPVNDDNISVSQTPPGRSATIAIEPFFSARQAPARPGFTTQTRSRCANLADANSGGERSEDWARSAAQTILDVRDIADVFKCSREKIKRMARSGRLPAFKFGKHWYVRREDLESFLANQVDSSSHLRRDGLLLEQVVQQHPGARTAQAGA